MEPKNPTPAFLRGKWKLEQGEVAGGIPASERAEVIAKRSGRDFSKTIENVRALIAHHRFTLRPEQNDN